MTDYKSINTYPKMNETIKDLLIFQGDNYTLYAAKRIEELEAENNTLSKTAKRIEKKTAREIFEYIAKSGVINVAPDTIKMFFKERYGVEVCDEK